MVEKELNPNVHTFLMMSLASFIICKIYVSIVVNLSNGLVYFRNKAKKKEKKVKEPRFAFLTKSEIDHLEDGYRWRKYGQKAVKNSPYPRLNYFQFSNLFIFLSKLRVVELNL